MGPSERLLNLARALSDSSSDQVDWESAEAEAEDDEERELVGLLRDIGVIADLRRTRTKKPGAETPLPPPSVWGQLEVLDKLGEGSAAEVFRARDRQLDRDVALKLFRHVGQVDPERRDALLVEGRNLALLRHDNVVRVHGADEHGGRIGIWMELVDGRTLAKIVQAQGPYSASETGQIGIELCGAVACVHRQRLIHADIKAQNVKREGGGRIVLMDFSSSRGAERSDEDSETTGTPLYMAPELWESEDASVESDIYALGVLLYYLVTGDFPLRARTIAALRRAHEDGARHRLRDERPGLPDAFVRTIEKALSRNPLHRFRSMGEFEEALRDQTGSLSSKGAPSPADGDVRLPADVRILARVARVAMWCGVAFGILGALGFITSTALNQALGRSSDYAPEPLTQWFVWGVRSLIGPVYHLVTTVAPLLAIYLVLRLAWKIGWIRRRLSAPLAAVSTFSARFRLDDPKVLAQVAVVVGSVVMGALVWWYYDLIGAIYGLRVAPIERSTIAILSPGNELHHLAYRRHFTLLVTALLVAAIIIRAYAKRRAVATSLAGIGAVLAVAVVLLEFPWQILWQAKFPRVNAGGEICYEVGVKDEKTLLFCPLSSHKTRLVPNDQQDYERTGIVESAFTLDDFSM